VLNGAAPKRETTGAGLATIVAYARVSACNRALTPFVIQ
jgi:hypothetical protein